MAENVIFQNISTRAMHGKTKTGVAAVSTAAGGEAGTASPKERIFSIIRKAVEAKP